MKNRQWFTKVIIVRISIVASLITGWSGINAQSKQLYFTNYSSAEGLSSEAVFDILRDSYGFLWLATQDGLNRFDGTNFKVYRHDPSNPNSLKVNYVTGLYESGDGSIWISTNGGGLSYYDRGKDSIFNFRVPGPIQLNAALTSVGGDNEGNVWVTGFGSTYIIDAKNKVLLNNSRYSKLLQQLNGKISNCFRQDHKGVIWVGTNEGLFRYHPGEMNITLMRHDPDDNTSLSHNQVVKLEEDKQGNLWVATTNGLGKLLPGSSQFKNYTPNSPGVKLSSGMVSDVAADNNNRLWIGTEEGLDILDIPTDILTSHTPDPRDPGSLSSRSVRSIYVDPKGFYWIGTFRGGLDKYDENANHFHLKSFDAFDPYGLSFPVVTSFAGYRNEIFIGTDGGGVQLFDRETGLLDHINLPGVVKNEKHDLAILSMEMARNNQLWIGTFINGLFKYDPATHACTRFIKGDKISDLNSNDIFCIKEDRTGNIWVGTNGGGVNVINPGSKQVIKYMLDPAKPFSPLNVSSNFIRAIEENKSGKMWIGTYGAGISVFDPNTAKFKFYNKENSGLPSDYIITIMEDSHGNMWAGTAGNGIGLLKKGSNKFFQINEKDGLSNSVINKIIEDATGKIWISTNKGLSYYLPATNKFKNYSHYDGLQPGGFMPGAGIKLADGNLFFGGQNGFNYFNPSELKTNKNLPPVVLTGIKIDNQEVGPSQDGAIEQAILLANKVHLKYKQTFSISFEALSFTVPEANQYEYQLEGIDKTWVRAGKEHGAYYANLPPGKYLFKVRASNNDGLWNQQGRNITIIVAPPYWRSIYAYIFYFLLITAILYYLRRLNNNKIKMRFALEQERREGKQLIERERKEAEYLHQLDQVKIKFLTNLSHEFRTPISLIVGPVDNLIRQIKDESLMNQLNLVKRNSKRLLNLVNQLLDFRKMEERELKLQCTEGDIIKFTREECDSFHDLARRKKIEFGFYTAQNSLMVLFDQNKLERILFNLLSNAFKFTPENGNIAVMLQASEDATTPGLYTVTISVKDSGIGIPKEVQSHIFESFFQHETGSEISNHGSGIGLSIAKEFVRLYNGNIEVESEPGKGSTFTFKLLLNAATENNETVHPLPVLNESTEETFTVANSNNQPSVLIVEDDDDFRLYLKVNLENTYRIFEAPNGKDGWQRALFHHPDIIICDVQMPIMNGLELAQKLKSDKRTNHIPLVLLTAANTIDATLDGLESGAIDYMTKPFDFAVLHAKIHNILLLNQSLKNTYSKQVTVSLPESEIVSEKEKFLQKILAYIYENLDNPQLSVEILSAHMFISRASLYNRLLEYTGKSPVEFIRSVKLEKARELLEKSDMTVTEIAYTTGFANPNYFAKVFKATYNMTPSDFVAEKKKENQHNA